MQASHEVVRVWCVCKDVVAEDQIGSSSFSFELRSRGFAKEITLRIDTIGTGDLCDVRRRFEAKAGHSGLNEVLQEVAVVAGYFNDEAVGTQLLLFNVSQRGFTCMLQHVIRE